MAPSGTHLRQFRSCLLVSSTGAGTLHLIRALHSAGFAVLERFAGPATLALAAGGDFDLVAWTADDGESAHGVAALARIAKADIPLIALLADATAKAVSNCLLAGADACLQLDADDRVVVAQAHAVLRRRTPASATPEDFGLLQVGDLSVDSDRCEVNRGGQYIPFTASEFRILEYMARYSGKVLRPHEILNAVTQDYEYTPREAQDVFKVYVRRIRRKLEPSEDEPRYLVTVRGFGYRLEGGTAASRPAMREQTA